MEILGIKDTIDAVEIALEANQPIALEGPPGIGKSSIVAQLAKKRGVKCGTLIASLCDPTDLGGFPIVVNDELRRVPLGVIKDLSKEIGILFFDEITTAPGPTQATLLRIVLDRIAGDTQLHPDTRIVLAYNPPDQAAGGNEMSLPLTSRMTHIRLRPERGEIQTYFRGLGAAGSTLRSMGADFAATLEGAPDLITIDPPAGAMQQGSLWGNPRSWERGLALYAASLDRGLDENTDKGYRLISALLSGSVGSHAAPAYMTFRKVRNRLPSIKEIETDPAGSKLPDDISTGVACIGLLEHVAQKNQNAAFVYANRLTEEIRVWATKVIVQRHTPDARKKFHTEALRARATMLGSMGAMSAG